MVGFFEQDIENALKVLRAGGVILYPTDTVWGIGCDARSSSAIKRVYEIKRRAESKALITLVGNIDMLERLVGNISPKISELINSANRPTTIIYPSANGVADDLKSDDGSLAIRVTAENWSKSLCEAFGAPIVSTSANISGGPTPATFGEIDSIIINSVDYVALSNRTDKPSKPSIIIRLNDDNTISYLRK